MFMKIILSLVIFLSIFLFQSPAFAQAKPNDCSKSFVSCVTSKFATKAPFDILGNIPKEKATCPAINFTVGTGAFSVSRNFDICFLYDLVKVVKYPLMAALIIKIYLFS
jgi:hypothetical protein